MTDKHDPENDAAVPGKQVAEEEIVQERRKFLIGLGKWSRAVIAGAVVGTGTLLTDKPAQAGWLNRRGGCCAGGGGWINRRGGFGGGSWINRR
jgi:hypothetical protein